MPCFCPEYSCTLEGMRAGVGVGAPAIVKFRCRAPTFVEASAIVRFMVCMLRCFTALVFFRLPFGVCLQLVDSTSARSPCPPPPPPLRFGAYINARFPACPLLLRASSRDPPARLDYVLFKALPPPLCAPQAVEPTWALSDCWVHRSVSERCRCATRGWFSCFG